MTKHTRPVIVYSLMVVLGAAAFLYPFWLPASALSSQAHSGGATIAILGMLSAVAGLLRLLDLPGGGSGIFFLVVLAGVAFGPRFGLLLGLCSMAVSAIVTGGIGPWLPFQMLALAWMGGMAGLVGLWSARLAPRAEIVVLAAYGWVWGFLYGAIMNLWFWPFARGGALDWHPGLGLSATLDRYWSFYVATSLGWDAAAAITNALLILLTGIALLRTLRRFAHRLEPVVTFVDDDRELASASAE
jgi:energy-coupling factor transport system substrate-specific component